MPFLGTTGGGSVKQYGGQANLGYFIRNSLRFRGSASAYLSRTPGSAGNRTTWTWSAWVKLGTLATARCLFGSGADTSNVTNLDLRADGRVQLYTSTSGSAVGSIVWNPNVYRDPAAWYHFVIAVDTTQATDTNRFKFYVNSVQVTGISGTAGENTWPTQNANTNLNNTVAHSIGRKQASANEYFDGYIAEVNLIDGQALTPSSFGKTDAVTGQWIPKKFAGTYGTNGFYLKFADASAATAAAIGKDSSTNGNNWTPNNISVTAGLTYDSMTDTPTCNYPTFNPLLGWGTPPTFADGNLRLATSGLLNNYSLLLATMAITQGTQWYWEVTFTGTNGSFYPGIWPVSGTPYGTQNNSTQYPGGTSSSYGIFADDGRKVNNNSLSTYGASAAQNDVFMFACDLVNNKLYVGKNGNWSNGSGAWNQALFANAVSAFDLTATDYFPATSSYSSNNITLSAFNFGQRPFSHTPPTGYKSLNTFNLP